MGYRRRGTAQLKGGKALKRPKRVKMQETFH